MAASTPAAAAAAPADSRVALVIGNNNYAASPLKNPVNDARAMASRLRDLGFQVVERENLTTRQIPATLREFRSRLKPGGVALFFYAGHGMQIKGINYLPAVDADIRSEDDVPLSSIDVNRVLDLVGEAKTRLNLVFLDACRNNPFARNLRAGGAGLAKVDAPSGTLISFATRPGSAAADGDGNNGLYTTQLLRHMDQGAQPIEQILKKVAKDVKQLSKGQQEPWSEGAIEGEFYFKDAGAGAGATVAAAAPTDALAIEVMFWDSARSDGGAPSYRAYLDSYPSGQFAALARAKLASTSGTERGGAAAPVTAAATAAATATAAHAGAATASAAVATAPAAAAVVVAAPAAVPTAAPAAARKLVAIAGFENRSTYGADKLWDTSGQLLTTNLLELGVFRLVEWERMKQLFDWQALASNSLVKSPESREKARKILLTEYFISGAVTAFDVSQKFESSTLSKRKTYTTKVRVDLQLQDAATGEYIGGAFGQSTEAQEFNGDLRGGQNGSWDPATADRALNAAIQQGLKKLIANYKLNMQAE